MVTHDPRAARRASTVKHLDKGVLADDVEAVVP
jgi:ABC-type lipoprotein export system ATPase subunit